MKLVIYDDDIAQLAERTRLQFPDVAVVATSDDAEAQREIVDADAMYGRITPELLAAATRLRWIQSPAIGLEHTMFPALIAHPVTMTNPRGIFADTIADHVMALVTGFARQMPRLLRQQLKRVWRQENYQVIHLDDCSLRIVGLGGICGAGP